MGRSPRKVFPRTVTLVEAFRRYLRAIHPDPALADKIESYGWLYFDPKRRSVDPDLSGPELKGEERAGEGREDEVKAFNEAHKQLGESVRQERGRFRLRGALHPSSPLEDIDPADAKVSKIHVFDGKLRVFDGNRHIKTYYRVECYETDVDRAVEMLPTPKMKMAGSSESGTYDQYLASTPSPSMDGYVKYATDNGVKTTRKELRDEYRSRNSNLKRGRRSKKSAGN
jgi:hypothetical protein